MMKLRKITTSFPKMKHLNALAREAFPPEEHIPPEELIRMSQEGAMDFWALYDGTKFIGFIVAVTFKTMAYLFFLAIDAFCRSHGYGSKALSLFAEQYPGCTHVVDMEMPEENAPNVEQRIARKKFYLRNGYKETGQYLTYRNTSFEVLCLENHFSIELFKELMGTLPVKNFNPRFFTQAESEERESHII